MRYSRLSSYTYRCEIPPKIRHRYEKSWNLGRSWVSALNNQINTRDYGAGCPLPVTWMMTCCRNSLRINFTMFRATCLAISPPIFITFLQYSELCISLISITRNHTGVNLANALWYLVRRFRSTLGRYELILKRDRSLNPSGGYLCEFALWL